MAEDVAAPSYDLVDALRLVPLFYTVNWTPEKKAEWLRITGSTEATTKVMCDHIRSAIEIASDDSKVMTGPPKAASELIARIERRMGSMKMVGERDDLLLDCAISLTAAQDAFDAGFKAAGGTMIPDNAREMVELSLDRDQINALADAADETIDTGSFTHTADEALRRFLDTISIYRRRK